MTRSVQEKVESRVQKAVRARQLAETASYKSLSHSPTLLEDDFEHQLCSQLQTTLSPTPSQSSGSLSICCSPSTDWTANAVAVFFADWIVLSDLVLENTSFLPNLCYSSESTVCLDSALSAAAFANQSNRYGLQWAAFEARKAYGRAVAALAVALQDPVEATKDSTLAAIHLVSLHEVLRFVILSTTAIS